MIPATVTFTDIAGLVRGASRGEGLGNRFLGHIREADATALVVRAFEDPDVTHVEGGVDPVRDIDVLELELQLADLETVTKRLERTEKSARLQKEKEPEMIALLRRVQEHLDQGRPVRTMTLTAEERRRCASSGCSPASRSWSWSTSRSRRRATRCPTEIVQRARLAGGDAIAVSARIENDIAELDAADRPRFSTTSASRSPACTVSRAARTGCSG